MAHDSLGTPVLIVVALAIVTTLTIIYGRNGDSATRRSWINSCAERKPIDWCEKHWEEMGRVEREAIR